MVKFLNLISNLNPEIWEAAMVIIRVWRVLSVPTLIQQVTYKADHAFLFLSGLTIF